MHRFVLLALLAACGGTDEPPPRTFGGDRPVDIQVPANYDPAKKYPLVVVLHGFGANGFAQTAVFHTKQLVDNGTAFVVAPDGTQNSSGMLFWNADPNCCDFEHQNPDDVAYIGGLIDDIKDAWPIDQVLVLGHSNGSYMAYRMACDRADVITAIAGLAGVAASTTCAPSRHVAVLHLHGTADDLVPYSTAVPSVTKWAGYNGCGTTQSNATAFDLDDSVAGAETTPSTFAGCPADGAVELWTMTGSSHIPNISFQFPTLLMSWFDAHQR
jgi:polyhydroxybutyrate depolymerase